MGCKIVAIAHGKSEVIMLSEIGSRMRVNLEVFDRSGGEEAIKLEHIGPMLSADPFDSEASLKRRYPKLDYLPKGPVRMPDLRIYPVMDRDGDIPRVGSYMSGDMFSKSGFHSRIIPILNIDSLDAVVEECGYGPIRNKVKDYRRLFATADLQEFYRRTVDNPRTNMNVFLYECMRTRPPFQGRIANGEIVAPKGIDLSLLRKRTAVIGGGHHRLLWDS